MADIRCPICAEPWDMDELHDVPSMSFAEASVKFRRSGCEVLGTSHGSIPASNQGPALIAAIYDLLGDDLDGAAVELEDAEMAGLLEAA